MFCRNLCWYPIIFTNTNVVGMLGGFPNRKPPLGVTSQHMAIVYPDFLTSLFGWTTNPPKLLAILSRCFFCLFFLGGGFTDEHGWFTSSCWLRSMWSRHRKLGVGSVLYQVTQEGEQPARNERGLTNKLSNSYYRVVFNSPTFLTRPLCQDTPTTTQPMNHPFVNAASPSLLYEISWSKHLRVSKSNHVNIGVPQWRVGSWMDLVRCLFAYVVLFTFVGTKTFYEYIVLGASVSIGILVPSGQNR